jgi:hypothetical protein
MNTLQPVNPIGQPGWGKADFAFLQILKHAQQNVPDRSPDQEWKSGTL